MDKSFDVVDPMLQDPSQRVDAASWHCFASTISLQVRQLRVIHLWQYILLFILSVVISFGVAQLVGVAQLHETRALWMGLAYFQIVFTACMLYYRFTVIPHNVNIVTSIAEIVREYNSRQFEN